MDETTNLKMPYIMASQAQKHVTHNEAIRVLDALVQISVLDLDLSAPPESPLEGARYIPASVSTGEWAGKEGMIAAFQDSVWMFYSPMAGFLAYVEDEKLIYVFDGALWLVYTDGKIGGWSSTLNAGTNGSQSVFELIEEELTLTGASVDSTIEIPDRAIVFAVTSRTTEAIVGATSYDCGIAGDIGKFGNLLSTTVDASNSGVIGPTAFYADTALRISANGGNFTGGKVRLSIHYMVCNPSAS